MPMNLGLGLGLGRGQLLGIKSKLLAPTIAVVTPLTNPPSFNIGLATGGTLATQIGDTVNLSVYNSGGTLFAGPLTHVITSGDFAAGTFSMSSGNLINGNVYYGETWVSRSGYTDSTHVDSGTFTSPAAAAPTATFQGNPRFTSSTPVSIGSAYATRRVVITFGSNWSGATLTSATILGYAATIHVQDASSADASCAIISAIVPTGTSISPSTDIVLNFSSTTYFSQQLGIYTINDALIVTKAPVTGHAIANAATSVSVSGLAIPAGAVIFAVTTNWAGGAVLTSVVDTQGDTFTNYQDANAVVSHVNGAIGGTATVTTTITSAFDLALCVAIWR